MVDMTPTAQRPDTLNYNHVVTRPPTTGTPVLSITYGPGQVRGSRRDRRGVDMARVQFRDKARYVPLHLIWAAA